MIYNGRCHCRVQIIQIGIVILNMINLLQSYIKWGLLETEKNNPHGPNELLSGMLTST